MDGYLHRHAQFAPGPSILFLPQREARPR